MNPRRYELLLRQASVSPLDCLRQMHLTVDQLEILVIFINRMGEHKASDVQAMLGLVEAEMEAQKVISDRYMRVLSVAREANERWMHE